MQNQMVIDLSIPKKIETAFQVDKLKRKDIYGRDDVDEVFENG